MVSSLNQILRRWRFGDPIVVISGLPRSGTSMAMKMLDAAGIPMVVDGIRTADEDNPKGYFELERVKDLAKESDWSWLNDARGKAIKIISYLLKELPPDHNYKVIFMRRELTEVLASQAKMLERRGEPNEVDDEKMVELYQNDLWKANYLLKHNSHFDFLEITYHEVLSDPMAQAHRMNDFLGSRYDPETMAAAVDPSLYRNRADALKADTS